MITVNSTNYYNYPGFGQENSNKDKETNFSNNTNLLIKNSFIDRSIQKRVESNFEKNSKKTTFLKNYLNSQMKTRGLSLPEGFSINTYSRNELNEHEITNLKKVLFTKFDGFVNEFFGLIEKPKDEFSKDLSEINIPKQDKKQIEKIYKLANNFYKVELTDRSGNKYDLVNLDEEAESKLLENSSEKDREALKEICGMKKDLQKITSKFSSMDIKRQMFFEAGKESREFIPHLLTVLGGLAGFDLAKGNIIKAVGPGSPAGKFLSNNIVSFIIGTEDDVVGGVKDYYQDKVVLGGKTALAVLAGSIATAVGTSVIAKSKFNTSTKLGAIGWAVFTSGASIFSTISTFALMSKNYNKMVKKGIVKEKENSGFLDKLKTTWNDFSSYDAYIGKIFGLMACVPGGLLLTKKLKAPGSGKKLNLFELSDIQTKKFSGKKFLAFLALTMVGSLETYTAVGFQLLGDKFKQHKIKKTQEKLINGKISVDDL